MTDREDIHRISWFEASKRTGFDQEELFQVGFLAGLEALEKGTNVYNSIKREIGHVVATQGSPVEVPQSSSNNSAIARLRRGELPVTPSERRIASVIGPKEDLVNISVVTKDTPESLLIEAETLEKLQMFLDYDRFYLTEQQRDAIGVWFFDKPVPKEYCKKYKVKEESIRWHKDAALNKMRKVLT